MKDFNYIYSLKEYPMSISARRSGVICFLRPLLGSLCLLILLPTPMKAQLFGEPPTPPISVTETKDGLAAKVGEESLHITVCADSVIHVVASPTPTEPPLQPWLLPVGESCPGARFAFHRDKDSASLTTATIKASFQLQHGTVDFSTVAGQVLLNESPSGPRTYEPVALNGENTYHVEDRFDADATEGLYGLGQHQAGVFNYRGSTVKLAQNNTDVAMPFLVSSKGYALLWNTASLTEVDNRFPLSIGISSLAGHSIDYFLIYGPEMDNLIHQYRSLTGHAPMIPKWAFGFFQSKDRYESQKEILALGKKYRDRHIPMDAIVQDWFWWKAEGDPVFNSNYTDVPAELKEFHDEHIHAMISTWGLFDPKAENFKTMIDNHFDVHDAHVYDATNPKARDFYWKNLDGKLLAMGWDAFWLDSAEPEEYWPHWGDAILQNKRLAIGNGAEYTNIFPLMHTVGVQEHWRADSDQKRVFLLTRSAFLGQQRVGATVWSGDVYSSFWALSHQVPAGLNFALSGYPYWTTDIGGYHQTYDRQATDPAYQELYTRWFEFGAFCPIFRSHGHRPHNEMWTYDKVEPVLLKYDKLRYRLMPYIYSLAWRVHQDDYTIQRPLVMDWRLDPKVREIGDQFMFGPAILVNPVMKENATARSLYLPDTTWYDFWTGTYERGGHDIEAEAPLDRLPLYIRAGSILPMGPEIEYADEKPEGPIELRIYTGADGKFDLYSDEGDNYGYEKGAHVIIPIAWSEASRTLTIGARDGSYPDMPKQIEFKIVWVGPNHGAGETIEGKPDATVAYAGSTVRVKQP
jgi:alpha-D-xyloside xylohydrolase